MTSQRHRPVAVEPTRGRRPAVVPAAVLAATRESVLAVGVRRTTLTDVARRAGVSRMTLYRLVPDVDALILELVTNEFGQLLRAAESECATLPTARDRLTETVIRVVRRLPAQPLFQRIVDVDPEVLLPYLIERVGSTERLAVEYVRAAVHAGIRDGSIRQCDADLVARCLVLSVGAFVFAGRFDGMDTGDADEELRRLLDRWLQPQ
jgi:AcrR family transcriptional regulator